MVKVTLIEKDFHFGIGFLNELLDGTGLKLNEFDTQDNASLVPKMMFYSMSYAAKRSGKAFDLSIEDIYDLIDENGGIGGKFWNDFYTAFLNAMYKDVPKEEDKKKVKAQK